LDKPLIIFHKLCHQTFGAACPALCGGISLAIDENKNLSEQQVQPTYADTLETLDFTIFGYDEEGLQGIASTFTTSPRNVSSEKPGRCHQRELAQNEKFSSLEGIYFEFKTFLDNLLPSFESALYRCRARYIVKTVHRCPGYIWSEFTLTPNITLSRSTLLSNEICPMCNRVIPQDVEIFN